MSKRGDNIHKRKDGRWEGRYKIGRKTDGTIHYGSVYGKSYKDVKEKLNSIQSNPQQLKTSKENGKTFGEVLELWMDYNRVRLKGGTMNKYQQVINAQILPELGKLKINQITTVQINSFLLNKIQHGRINDGGPLSASYVKTIVLILNAVFKFAVREQLCHPLNLSISKPTIPKKELVVLSLSEQQLLESFLIRTPTPTNLGILISLHTGLRIGEICALKWNDIDFNKQILHVRHTIARVPSTDTSLSCCSKLIIDSPKTPTSYREIPISSTLLSLLKELYPSSASPYVTSSKPDFVSPRTFEYRYHKVLNQCGIKSVNYHVLRHTFATRCVEAGVDIKSLSEILGHANVGITLNTYVHSSIELKRTQLEKMLLLTA